MYLTENNKGVDFYKASDLNFLLVGIYVHIKGDLLWNQAMFSFCQLIIKNWATNFTCTVKM